MCQGEIWNKIYVRAIKMHDFRCLGSVDILYLVLAKQVKYYKETEGHRKIMSQIFEDLAKKWAEELDLPIEVVRDLAGLQLA